jgi:integrase
MQHLNRDEIRMLVRAINQPLWRLMTKTGFWHGLRVTELNSMVKEDALDGFINVKRLKGSLHTIQPYVKHEDPDLDEYAELTELVASLKPGQRLFPITRQGYYGILTRAGIRVGLPKHKRHPHVLKHSIAMQSIGGAGIENVRQWLGHKSIASTGEYLRVSDQAAAAAIGKAMGL